jgi:hypothetical protein
MDSDDLHLYSMNSYDLQRYNQAIGLAQANQKEAAHEIFEQLMQRYTVNANVLLWFAFTAESWGQAHNAIEVARRYEPDNPGVAQAQAWLEEQAQIQFNAPESTALTISTSTLDASVDASHQILTTLPPSLQKLARQELKPTEEILWCGMPNLFRYVLSNFGFYFLLFGSVALLVLLGLVYLTYFDTANVPSATFSRNQASSIRVIIILGPFCILNLGAALQIFYSGTQTGYLLTKTRVLVLRGGWLPSVKVYGKDIVKSYNVKVVEHRNGFGDLIFATELEKYSNRDPSNYMTKKRGVYSMFNDSSSGYIKSDGTIGISSIGLRGIPEVRRVEQLFRQVF